MATLLQVKNLTKSFGSVIANNNISFEVNAGEIVALLGENGAGKSTLVKSVFGLLRPDQGEIYIDGKQMAPGDTAAVIASGVGMVHQHFQLVPVMSVTENIILGDEPKDGIFISIKKAEKKVRALSEKFGLAVDPTANIEDLPVGMQQRVEILKALSKDVRLLIFDEPTAVLTPQETDELILVIKNLAQLGVGVIVITHKLREVMALADRVVVLRDGKVVGTTTPKQSDEAGLAQMMVGRNVVLEVSKGAANPGQPVLSVKGLEVFDDRKLLAVKGVDLQVRSGEILGIAGVEGNGQRELVEAIFGMRVRAKDREKHGLVSSYSIADNLILNRFDQQPFARGWFRNMSAIKKNADLLVKKFDIRTTSPAALASALSGGNKQKVVIARELSQDLQVLVAAQPTRGVDVGSIEFIHKQLIAARDGGAGVLLVSAELDEIISLSDRIAVMSGGIIVATIDNKNADRDYLGRLMAGLSA
jgi:simple sugar transport system ATP-binding protein